MGMARQQRLCVHYRNVSCFFMVFCVVVLLEHALRQPTNGIWCPLRLVGVGVFSGV